MREGKTQKSLEQVKSFGQKEMIPEGKAVDIIFYLS
jgi:hypothetical protein